MKTRIFILMAILLGSVVTYAAGISPREITKLSNSVNKTLPKKIDSITWFMSTSVDSKTFYYHYKVDRNLASFDLSKVNSHMRTYLKPLVCANALSKKLLSHAINITFEYVDKKGKAITEVTFKPGDCP